MGVTRLSSYRPRASILSFRSGCTLKPGGPVRKRRERATLREQRDPWRRTLGSWLDLQ